MVSHKPEPVPDPTVKPLQLSPKQIEAMKLCRERSYVLLSGPRRSSKCVSPDTLVYTDQGLIPIGRMGNTKEGLFSDTNHTVVSMSVDGKSIGTAKAEQFYNSGTKKALAIKTDRGYEIICSYHHPLWSECSGEIRYRTAEEIRVLQMEGSEVWLPLVREQARWPEKFTTVGFHWYPGQDKSKDDASKRIRNAMRRGAKGITQISSVAKAAPSTVRKYAKNKFKPRHAEIVIDNDIGYMLGLFVGDGCYSAPVVKESFVGFSSLDAELISFLNVVFEKRFEGAKLTQTAGCNYVTSSALFRTLLGELGMSPKYSYEKDVPSVIAGSPRSVIIAFLQGLFDTDGTTCKNGHPSYCTTSIALSKGVQNLLLAVGVRCRRRFTPNDYRGAWLITPRLEDGFFEKVGFRLSRKQSRMHNARYRLTAICYPPSLVRVLKRLHDTRKSRGVGKLPRKTHKHIIDAVLRRNLALSKAKIAPLVKTVNGYEDDEFQSFWMQGDVWWDKLETVSPTECQLVDIAVPVTHNFIGNGFINHNTLGGLACMCDHAWRVPHAEVALVSISQSSGLGSGVWDQLMDAILPQYMALDEGMKWVRKPFTAQSSKRPTAVVTNAHGGTSRFQLESLKDENEVEERFKNKSYTAMFVTELSHYRNAGTFKCWKQSLRSAHGIDPNLFLFLGDTNPSDEGTNSWLYHQWFIRRTQTYAEYCDFQAARGLPISSEEDFTLVNSRLGLLEFEINDNWFLTDQEIRELIDNYSHDHDLYDRYILGKWVEASAGALFSQHFREGIHVAGEFETPGNPDPEILVPHDSTWSLFLSVDPGTSANSAGSIFEKVVSRPNPESTPVPCFNILDELAIIGQDHTLEEFTLKLCEIMLWWEQRMGRVFEWHYWSDRSVFEHTDQTSHKFYHQIIFDVSARFWRQKYEEMGVQQYAMRAIALQAADRSRGSLEQRVDIARKLLFEERLRISRRCPNHVQAFKSLPPDKRNPAIPAKGHKMKHIFDAMMYGVSQECYTEATSAVMRALRNGRSSQQSGLVSIAV